MPELSDGAKQLHSFMIQNRLQVWDPREGRHPILFVFEIKDDDFRANYKPYLDELKQIKWIQGHERPSWIVLGYGVIQAHLFGEQMEVEQLIELLFQRYTLTERSTLETLFQNFGNNRARPKEFTGVALRAELEYYSRYPTDIVVKSAMTYLTLKTEQQHGPQYLRGIIRNESQRIATEQKAPHLSQAAKARPAHQPAEDYTLKKERATWVQSQIDLNHYQTLTPEQATDYIRTLEAKFDEQRTT